MLLLIDGFDYRLVHRYLDSMPNVRRIMEEGYSAQILPFASTWGNINYTSLITGAAPGTQYRQEKLPDLQDPSANPGCAAETIWQALDSDGRKSVLIDYPQSYPPGAGLTGVVAPTEMGAPISSSIFGPKVYQTPDVRTGVYDLSKVDRSGWPPGGGPNANRSVQWLPTSVERNGKLETSLVLTQGVDWRLNPTRGSNGVFDQVHLYRTGEDSEPLVITPDCWTNWIEGTANGRKFKVRFRLLYLSADGRSMSLLSSSGCPIDTISDPPELGEMLLSRLGPYTRGTAIPLSPNDPDYQVGMEELVESVQWAVNAAELAFREWGAELFIHKTHVADDVAHQCASMIDPTYYRYDPARAEPFDRVLRENHAATDGVIGHLLEVAESMGNTHVVIAGDHGICINNVVCDVNRRLRDVDLLSMNADGSIDMSQTLAYTRRDRQGNEIFVNLRGRGSTGIVDPANYEEIQEHIIDALLDWRDPHEKKRAVCFALSKRDAQVIGYWGKECGDVIFTYNQGFTWGVNPGGETIAMSTAMTTNHGAGIQTQDTGVSSNMSILLAWGPKVKAGVKRDSDILGPIPINNIGPTVTALLGCRPPRHATGGIIGEMFA
ncbi:alkaline phosphatase family protein [Candidatus Poribacteria bacterium]